MHADDSQKSTILVVDDEELMTEALKAALASRDYAVLTAENGEQGLDLATARDVDLVLADVQMPGMDGLELLEKIKAAKPELDVVMITARADLTPAITALRTGASDYLTKPFRLEELFVVVGRVLEKRHLVLQNREYREHLEQMEAYERTVQALVSALEARDDETSGHSLRVVAYALRLGRELGIEGRQLEALRWGSILHDIGKIAVPDSILRKPGPLDENERREMERHPQAGVDILKHIPFLAPALDVVHCHQEHWDGGGYPRGLAGDAIPLIARVFAVADTFDAITSDRPYRAARGFNAAAAEIERCAGSQFDPQVARAFQAVGEAEWRRLQVESETAPAGAAVEAVVSADPS